MPRQVSRSRILLFAPPAAVLALLFSPATASSTTCTEGFKHNTLDTSRFPYTDDINFSPDSIAVVPGDPNLSGPFYTLVAGCDEIQGKNLRASESFSTLLRAYVRVKDATAPTGSLYELRLVIGTEVIADYSRRLRGTYPDGDYFEASKQNLAAGQYAFRIEARLFAAADKQMRFDVGWINAQGAPYPLYPSAQTTNPAVVTVTTTWTRVADTLVLNPSSSVDLFMSGYTNVNAGTTASRLDVEFRVDQLSERDSSLPVPGIKPDSVRALDHRLTVQPGQHNVELWAKVDAGVALLQYGSLHVVSFPGYTAARQAAAFSPVAVDTQTTGPQPITNLNDGLGLWTKVLEMQVPEIPQQPQSQVNLTVSAYVEILGNTSGSTAAQVAVEFVNPVDGGGFSGVDIGWTDFQLKPGRGALYPFGDGLHTNSGLPEGSTIRLWLRKLLGSGSFQVGQRYLAIKQVSAPGTVIP